MGFSKMHMHFPLIDILHRLSINQEADSNVVTRCSVIKVRFRKEKGIEKSISSTFTESKKSSFKAYFGTWTSLEMNAADI